MKIKATIVFEIDGDNFIGMNRAEDLIRKWTAIEKNSIYGPEMKNLKVIGFEGLKKRAEMNLNYMISKGELTQYEISQEMGGN